jgi:hypothetical protein
MNFNDFNAQPRNVKQLALSFFRNMLVRDLGFTHYEAEMEVDFIRPNDIFVTEYHYVYKVRRVGTTKTLNRAERLSVYQTLQNAFNQATHFNLTNFYIL